MKNYIILVLFSLILIACGSKDEITSADIKLNGKKSVIRLYYENSMNPDGLVERTVSINNEAGESLEYPIHIAHYSDIIFPKILQTDKDAFLIAEDSTGYTVWNIHNKELIIQSEIEDNVIVDNPEGTGRDFMTHRTFSDKHWLKTLNIKSKDKAQIEIVKW